MSISLHYCGINARALWLGLSKVEFKKLEKFAAITSARITVKRQNRSGQPYQVKASYPLMSPTVHQTWPTGLLARAEA